MYYDGAKNILISFIVSLFTSIIVCVIFFFVVPQFRKPEADTMIPDMIGSTTEQARVIAESRSLLLVVGGEEENDKVAENLICRQTPLPGSAVRTKSTVTVFISKGSSKIVLPDFKGQGLSEATVKLSEMDLKIGEVRSEENSDVGKDKIISTIPKAGSRVNKGDIITVVLSRGVELVQVPRLIGKSLSSAKRIIEDKGFVVGNVSYEVSIDYNVGIVMRQSPGAGKMIKKGSKIHLVIATVLE
jgi:beta-lactam-binding protein with PASTA domain